MCIFECFSLCVDQSLIKTDTWQQKILMNVCPECVHDCTRLALSIRTWGVFLFLISFDSHQAMFKCVFWMFCGRQVCGELLNASTFYNNCLTVELGANCDAFTGHAEAFTIWPNHIVKQKWLHVYNLSPLNILRLPHKPFLCPGFSKSIFKYVHSDKCMKPLV